MKLRQDAENLAIAEPMMRNGREQFFRHRVQRVGVMEHGQAFRPGLLRLFIYNVPEGSGQVRVRVVIVICTRADHDHARRLEAGLPAQPVEFRDRAARREQHRTDMFCLRLEEEAGRDFLVVDPVCLNLYRRARYR
jgi:hypothetical protein